MQMDPSAATFFFNSTTLITSYATIVSPLCVYLFDSCHYDTAASFAPLSAGPAVGRVRVGEPTGSISLPPPADTHGRGERSGVRYTRADSCLPLLPLSFDSLSKPPSVSPLSFCLSPLVIVSACCLCLPVLLYLSVLHPLSLSVCTQTLSSRLPSQHEIPLGTPGCRLQVLPSPLINSD